VRARSPPWAARRKDDVRIVGLDGSSWDAPPSRCDVLVMDAGAWRGAAPGDGVRALRARAPRATLIVHGAGCDGALRARLLESGADLVFGTTAEFHAIREVLGELLLGRPGCEGAGAEAMMARTRPTARSPHAR
jgi:hypothetical protein